MEQAKYYPCAACQSPIPPGHKFCGRCGETTPDPILHLATNYFGDLQDPSKANLVVIRGEGQEGLSYHLSGDEHALGREAQIQIDDPFVSPLHANLYYRGSSLTLRDENSVNGTYTRIRDKAKLAAGDTFMAGDQLFRVEPMPVIGEETDSTGTFFYGSPTFNSSYRITQILEGNRPGLTLCPRTSRATIGRQGCDLNVIDDPFLSEEHCAVEQDSNGFTLTDLGSKNGTYVRLKSEQRVEHSDYFIVGRRVLRVEINA
ncbi:MAG TPA: FHA domain-containing protein [Polyangiaceae bacterium]|nr:FHA domain-containing protein [Polyangiaceae bacterium]